MTSQTPDLATLAARQENLEQQYAGLARQNRRLRLGLALLALLAVLALASSFPRSSCAIRRAHCWAQAPPQRPAERQSCKPWS